jgi:pimeloyl-ACP methyl ester carboxylesterase
MTLPQSTQYNYIDRGYDTTMVLFPGWAMDYRIFDNLDAPYNYIIPVLYDPYTAGDALTVFLDEQQLSSVTLLGWSMGGYSAADWAAQHADRVAQLYLVGMRMHYEAEGIEQIMKHIRRNSKAFLRAFYGDSVPKPIWNWFNETLFPVYAEQFTDEILCHGLHYLRTHRIDPSKLAPVKKVTIVHGKDDLVARVLYAEEIHHAIPHSTLQVIEDGSHAPFLVEGMQW